MPTALLILAEGAEEMELVITADVLRRGGVEVTIAGLAGEDNVKCSRSVVIKPDKGLTEAALTDYDAVICPGGMGGAEALAASPAVAEILKKHESQGKIIACICAAPIALKSHGVGLGKTVTSHPAVEQRIREGDYVYSDDRVVVDGKLVTSRGPGTCFEFALKLVELLQSNDTKNALIPPMLLKL